MIQALTTAILTNKGKLFALSLLSFFTLGVIGYGVMQNKTENKPHNLVEQYPQPTSIAEGQIAGVAITVKLTPTPTRMPYKPRTSPTYTSVPSSSIKAINQPQTNTTTTTGNNSQSNQNTTTQTPSPIYITQQPTTQPTAVPEQIVVITLEITHDTSKGMIYANKQLKECFITGGKHAVHGTALTPGKGVVGGTTCFVGAESPDWVDVHGYVIDFEGQQKGF